VFKKDLVMSQEYLGFLLLNIFDLFLTGFIFRHSGQEANGIPALVLKYFHLAGFAIFKFAMVAFIIILCEIISLFKVERARQVIIGACALYVVIICYEAYIIFAYVDHPLRAPKPVALDLFHQIGVAIGLLCSA